jgi:hypothetical protein
VLTQRGNTGDNLADYITRYFFIVGATSPNVIPGVGPEEFAMLLSITENGCISHTHEACNDSVIMLITSYDQ